MSEEYTLSDCTLAFPICFSSFSLFLLCQVQLSPPADADDIVAACPALAVVNAATLVNTEVAPVQPPAVDAAVSAALPQPPANVDAVAATLVNAVAPPLVVVADASAAPAPTPAPTPAPNRGDVKTSIDPAAVRQKATELKEKLWPGKTAKH